MPKHCPSKIAPQGFQAATDCHLRGTGDPFPGPLIKDSDGLRGAPEGHRQRRVAHPMAGRLVASFGATLACLCGFEHCGTPRVVIVPIVAVLALGGSRVDEHTVDLPQLDANVVTSAVPRRLLDLRPLALGTAMCVM